MHNAALMVAPLNIARGTQNKILEAMALGVPVVASELASKGIDAVPGEHLLSARTPADYVAAIDRVLDDPALAVRLGVTGRANALDYSWSSVTSRVLEVYQGILDGIRVVA